MLDPQSTLQWQARRIEELEAEVISLRNQLADILALPERAVWCAVFGLPAMQGRILDMLMTAQGIASRIWLEDEIWPGYGGNVKALEVHICKIRARLRAVGLSHVIETLWGQGWRISPESRQRIHQYAAARGVEPEGRAR